MLTQRRLGFLAGFLAYLAALWFLWDTRILYPLKIFVVFLHELSHGIAAILGGGSIQRIGGAGRQHLTQLRLNYFRTHLHPHPVRGDSGTDTSTTLAWH